MEVLRLLKETGRSIGLIVAESIMFLLICLVTWKVATAIAVSPQVTIRGLPNVMCTSPVSYYVDLSRKLSFNDIKGKTFSTRQDGLSESIRKHGQHAHYWIRFSLDNLNSLAVKAYFDAGYFGVVRVYEIQKGRITLRSGGLALRKDLTVSYPELSTVRLVIPPQATTQYFVCLYSTPDYVVKFEQVNIFSPELLHATFYQRFYESRTFRFLQILFFGLMLTQMIYLVFSWFIGSRRKEYIFYLMYLILITAYFLLKFNRDVGIYWPFEYYPAIRAHLKSVSLALPYLFYLKFARYFLDLSELDKKIFNKFIYLERIILVYVSVDTVLRFVLPSPDYLNGILIIAISAISVYCLILIFRLMRHKRALVNLILTGSLVAAVGGGLGDLVTFLKFYVGTLHTDFDNIISAQVGIVLETIIFTISLSYKTRMMEIEKVRDQKKLIAQMKENAELKGRMEQTRSKIAQDLHDDIGSTLSSILLLSNAAKTKIRFDPGEGREIFGKISEIAGSMMDEMSDIIWSINPRNDRMDQILKRMQYYAAPLALARSMKFYFETREDIQNLYLSLVKRKNLFLIFKESILNALKYSEGATLRVRLYRTDSRLHMLVEDDGKGFSHVSDFGNGLSNMKERAENAGGELEISSVVNLGTKVHVTLPL